MALADYQQLVNDMVRDQAAIVTPDVQGRAIEQARVRYSADCEHDLGGDPAEDTIPVQHRLPVASLAASMLCQQLATYFSGQRETTLGADASQTETRAREFAARAKEYRTAYYVGTGQIDPYAKPAASTGSGATAAAAVATWPGRPRNRLTGGVL